MKVLMVSPTFYPIEGGAERANESLSIELNKIGVHTDVMTFNINREWTTAWKGKTEKMHGFTVFRIPALNWFPLTRSYRITLEINFIPGRFQNLFKEYDIIHFHGYSDLSFPFFSLFVRKKKILHLHGFNFDLYRRYFLARCVLKRVANVYLVYTRPIKTELIKIGIPEHKIKYLPNGIDVNVFSPSEKKEDNLILFVGRITFLKGLHVLLKSLHYLEKPIHLVIIGPADWDSAYFEEILATIERMKKNTVHSVTYLGRLEREKIIDWYQKASILIRPDCYPQELGSGGLTALEALACGTPVIGTANDVIKNGTNGIIVPQNNPSKLAEAIKYLMENKGIRIRMGEEGRKRIIKDFSLEVVAKKLCRIYDQILASYA